MVDDIAAPARIAGKDALSVGMAAEGPAGGEFLSQLDIVINLAVKGDGRAVDPFHRLAGFFAEIDDRQAAMAKSRLSQRSEERRVGQEGVRRVRCGGWP